MSEIRVDNITDEAGTGAPGFSQGLPADALTGNVAADRITDALNATGSAPIYACRTWVNFDGTGTVSIRDSGNVSSITDITTGEYTVNFATAMPDANYCVSMTVRNEDATGTRLSICENKDTPRSSSDVSIEVSNYENDQTDSSIVSVATFR